MLVIKARTRTPPRLLNAVPRCVITGTLRELGMLALYTRSSCLRVHGAKLRDMESEESESAVIEVFRHPELWLSIAGLLGWYRKPLSSGCSNPTLRHCAYHLVVVPQWFIHLSTYPQLMKQYSQLPSHRNHGSLLAFFPPRSASFNPRRSLSCPEGPRM